MKTKIPALPAEILAKCGVTDKEFLEKSERAHQEQRSKMRAMLEDSRRRLAAYEHEKKVKKILNKPRPK